MPPRQSQRSQGPPTYASTPYSEVTGPVCRVPKRGFSLAPEDFLLTYLCRFAVRVPTSLLRGFSWQHGVTGFAGCKPSTWSLRECDSPDLPGESPYRPEPTRPIVGSVSLLRPLIVITKSR